jgi:predicted flap endonuclease-1-like 5' DNA nuclease
MKNPPILVAVLGFFAAVAGFGWLFLGLRILGFDWFGLLGDLPRFEAVGLWGWLATLIGIVWLLAAGGLWALQPWARLFAQVMAGIALFGAILAFFQFPGTGIGFAMAIVPAVILWYLSSREVRAAFATDEQTAVASDTTALEPAAAPVAVAAPVAAAAPFVAETMEPDPVVVPVAAAAAALEQPHAAHHLNIADIEGIGPGYAEKLAGIGIKTADDLLSAGAKPSGRDHIAVATEISEKLILEWVNNIDLMRVPGVGPQYSDLLEAAGVDSPAELALRNSANLAITVQEVVAERPGIVRRIPTEAEIASWVAEAGKMEKVVEH